MILITVLAIWIFSLCLHEYCHARVAYAGGDHTVADKGYLSFNPFRYMNPLTSIVLPALFVMMGWIALPGGAVWIETWRLRSRGWVSAVSLAGPGANLLVCILLGLPFLVGAAPAGMANADGTPRENMTMWLILAASCYWQAIAVILNLLPIPGLDGYGALEPWLPPKVQEWGRRFKPYGFFLLVILFISSRGFQRFFGGAVAHILAVLRVDHELVNAGLSGMFFWQN